MADDEKQRRPGRERQYITHDTEPGDEKIGQWAEQELLDMDQRFRLACLRELDDWGVLAKVRARDPATAPQSTFAKQGFCL